MRQVFSFVLVLLLTGCAELLQVAGQMGQTGPLGPPTESEVISGLKSALEVGIRNSVSATSATNGFFGNSLIRIPFPPEAQKMESTLRNLGLNKPVDDFVLTLNRGAEKASAKATDIFIAAISQMTFQDAMAIWKGDSNAATAFLQRTTTQQLKDAFAPIIKQSLDQVEVTKYWNPLASTYNSVPFVTPVNPNLDQYVLDQSLNGLFKMVALEEAKIRRDPAARVNDILKRVFGWKS